MSVLTPAQVSAFMGALSDNLKFVQVVQPGQPYIPTMTNSDLWKLLASVANGTYVNPNFGNTHQGVSLYEGEIEAQIAANKSGEVGLVQGVGSNPQFGYTLDQFGYSINQNVNITRARAAGSYDTHQATLAGYAEGKLSSVIGAYNPTFAAVVSNYSYFQ